MVAAAGRRVATGTVRRSQRECEDGKSERASKDNDSKDEGGGNRLESEERRSRQGFGVQSCRDQGYRRD